MQVKVTADWEKIKEIKRKSSLISNDRENKARLAYPYQEGNTLLIINREIKSKMESPTEEPYEVLKVFTNGTIRIRRGNYNEVINIRCVKLFSE